MSPERVLKDSDQATRRLSVLRVNRIGCVQKSEAICCILDSLAGAVRTACRLTRRSARDSCFTATSTPTCSRSVINRWSRTRYIVDKISQLPVFPSSKVVALGAAPWVGSSCKDRNGSTVNKTKSNSAGRLQDN